MNLDNLNRWLTLAANIGVLIGIFAVVTELRQTQIIMSAESSMQRAQFSRENASTAIQNRIGEITRKLENGEDLTEDEFGRAKEFADRLLRHQEVMHYQYQLGILDSEIWQNNADGIRNFMDDPIMKYVYPNWPVEGISLRMRKSFVDFTMEFRD